MTIKVLTTYAAAGYTLNSKYNELSITNTGGVGGSGLHLTAYARVISYGTIHGTGSSNGVSCGAGGYIFNGSAFSTSVTISGYSGVFAPNAAVTVVNYGTVLGNGAFGNGVFLVDGGFVANGGGEHAVTSSLIKGQNSGVTAGGVLNIFNGGTIYGVNGQGVYVQTGGSIGNSGLIESKAAQAIYAKSGVAMVHNLGGISSKTTTAILLAAGGSIGNYGGITSQAGVAVSLGATGTITNGSAAGGGFSGSVDGVSAGVSASSAATVFNDDGSIYGAVGVNLAAGGFVDNGGSGTISGRTGVVAGAPATVINGGSIYATYGGVAVSLSAGGAIDNTFGGVISDGVALTSAAGSVQNYGSIFGFGRSGVELDAGGTITNGLGGHIDGLRGVAGRNVAATVRNFGSIQGDGYAAVALYAGGTITNGSASDRTTVITAGASAVQGVGVAATVVNFGTIASSLSTGANLAGGGQVTNGSGADTAATIQGANAGVNAGLIATVTNFGTISGSATNGVTLLGGGTATNGSALDILALMTGYSGLFTNGAAASIANFGTIEGTARYGEGVFADAGGTVINGASNDTKALIQGPNTGVDCGAATTVKNLATIVGIYSDGVLLAVGGSLANGASYDQKALVAGARRGVGVTVAAGTVSNFGQILATGARGYGASFDGAAGTLTNGAAGATAALIFGDGGVQLNAGGSIGNFGTIEGAALDGVYLKAGGRATNGSAAVTSALISGAANGLFALKRATATNFGTVSGASGSGVSLKAGGLLANGSLTDRLALAEGYSGLVTGKSGTATIANFGTLRGVGSGAADAGADLGGAGSLVNGAASDTIALVEGYVGVIAAARATVTNFGIIAGDGGTAVRLGDASDVLVVETGCGFEGAVLGGGGTLDLDTGTGTLSGLLNAGSVTVSGSMAATLFQNFNTVEIGATASFVTSGAVSLAAGQSLIDAGSLTLGSTSNAVVNGGTIEVTAGTLTVNGAVTGAGSVTIAGGLADFTSSFNQAVSFTGTLGTLELAKSQGYGGAISGFSTSGGTALDLDDIAFGGSTTASYSGGKSGGVLTVTDGTHTAHINLVGNFKGSSFQVASDGRGGTLVTDPQARRFASAMASLAFPLAGSAAAFISVTQASPALVAPPAK